MSVYIKCKYCLKPVVEGATCTGCGNSSEVASPRHVDDRGAVPKSHSVTNLNDATSFFVLLFVLLIAGILLELILLGVPPPANASNMSVLQKFVFIAITLGGRFLIVCFPFALIAGIMKLFPSNKATPIWTMLRPPLWIATTIVLLMTLLQLKSNNETEERKTEHAGNQSQPANELDEKVVHDYANGFRFQIPDGMTRIRIPKAMIRNKLEATISQDKSKGTIGVAVMNSEQEFTVDNENIKDLLDEETENIPSAKVIDTRLVKLAGFPAAYLHYSYRAETLEYSGDFELLKVVTFNRNRAYQVTCFASKTNFPGFFEKCKAGIASFGFIK